MILGQGDVHIEHSEETTQQTQQSSGATTSTAGTSDMQFLTQETLPIQGKCLALIDLKGHVITIVQDRESGNVYMYEKWSQDEDLIEVELGNIGEEQIIEEVVKRIDEEFKLPKSIRGALKARIKQVKLPVTIRLIQEDRVNIIDVKGQKGKFQLAIKYHIQ